MPSKKSTDKAFVKYHNDGSVWAKGQHRAGKATGYWEWFRKDGTRMRSGYFEGDEQVGKWTTYDQQGTAFKVTDMKSKAGKSKP
jgi:antitoxin component YwqK of YwqJK toxin-antitoxin module